MVIAGQAAEVPLLRRLVGQALRRRRLAQGRTLRDVAGNARVSMPYLSEVERGLKEASSEVLAALCRALGVRLADLLDEVRRELARVEPQPAEPARIGFTANLGATAARHPALPGRRTLPAPVGGNRVEGATAAGGEPVSAIAGGAMIVSLSVGIAPLAAAVGQAGVWARLTEQPGGLGLAGETGVSANLGPAHLVLAAGAARPGGGRRALPRRAVLAARRPRNRRGGAGLTCCRSHAHPIGARAAA